MIQIRHVLGIPKTTPYRDTIHVYVPNGNGFMLPKVLCHTLCHHFRRGGTRRNMKCMLVVSAVLIWCLITIHVQFYIFITIKNSVSTSADLHSESVQELQHVPVYSTFKFLQVLSLIYHTTQLFKIKFSHLSRPRQQLGPGAIAQPRSQIT